MKKLLFYLLFAAVVCACKNGQTAEDYYTAGVAKMQEKPDANDKLSAYRAAVLEFDKAIALNPEYVDALEKRAVLSAV